MTLDWLHNVGVRFFGEGSHINNKIKKWVYDKVVNKVYDNHIYIVNYAGYPCFTEEEWANKLYPEFKYEKRSINDHVELHYHAMDNILEFDFQIHD